LHLDYSIDAVLASFGAQQVFMFGWCAFILAGLWLARRAGLARLCTLAALPLLLVMWLWTFYANFTQGGGAWTRVPLFNPLDAVQLLFFGVVYVWLRRWRQLGIAWRSDNAAGYAAIATLFVWFNALLLRTLHHHFLHLDYSIDAVLASFGAQQVFMFGWCAFVFAGLWLVRRPGPARLCTLAALPLLFVMWLWTFYANFTQGGGAWTRVPLLNPLDLVQLAIYALTALWLARLGRIGMALNDIRVPLRGAAGVTLFVWLNAMLLRTLHHWAGVPYTLNDMANSMLAQAAVSVFWTLCALAAMIWATRRYMRLLWFVGAALLGLTVVKLFLFDLSYLQGLERIVSFISIGVLLLLIGYFSPLPPKARALPGAGGNP
jgi:uncharacterized membrane protein